MDLGGVWGPERNPRKKAILAFQMATLLICPACGTRYEIKAVLPPEGRKVRCSKCAHVWQAFPVRAPPVAPAPQPAPTFRPAAPPMPQPAPQPPPRPASADSGMGAFPGITPSQPPPPIFSPPQVGETDLAAQLARINAEAMAEAQPEPPPEKRGGIFSRLTRKREPVPPVPAAMTDIFAPSPGLSGDASMDEGAAYGAARAPGLAPARGDATMGYDAALADQALPDEKPPRRRGGFIVALGWLALALFVVGVIGALAYAPSAIMSVLPGASRLYSLVGMPIGAGGLTLEQVRYGWTSDGAQSVLEVQGEVVNLTSNPVAVPTVVIALRDAGGAEISEWTTEIGEEQLAGGERAPFLRQIPSPPSNVRSVAVRFAKAK